MHDDQLNTTTTAIRNRQRGLVGVEFALAFPVFMVVIAGGLSLGRVLITKHNLESAVSYVTRAHAIANKTEATGIQSDIRTRLGSELSQCSPLTTTVNVIFSTPTTPAVLEVKSICKLTPMFKDYGFGVDSIATRVAMPIQE